MIEPSEWIGRQIGKYRITRFLGRGGMGSVFEGVDRHLERPVAIKLLAAESDNLPRLLREARTAARVNHPNVVAVYDVGKHQKTFYLVMELIRGRTAHEWVRDSGPLSESAANRLVMSICKGLRAAHAAGLIHRDIKPANILCPNGAEAQLVDFGLAKPALETAGRLTHADTLIGTPHFMSPEQCRCEPLDERSDLYSLGATWYFLLTGRPPFDSADRLAVLFSHCSDPLPDPRLRNTSISVETADLIRRAMAKNRSDRFPDAHSMHEAIAARSKETPLPIPAAPAETNPIRSRKPEPRRRVSRWWLALPAAVTFLTVWAAVAPSGRERNRPPSEEEQRATAKNDPLSKQNPNAKNDPVPSPVAKKVELKEFPYRPIAVDPTAVLRFWHLGKPDGGGPDAGGRLTKFFPDSVRFASSDTGKTLTVWQPPLNRFSRLIAPSGGVIDLAGGKAGQWLAAAGQGPSITLYSAPEWRGVGAVNLGQATPTCLAAHGDWLAAGTQEGLQFFDLSRFPVAQPVQLPGTPEAKVLRLRRSHDGSRLASVDANGFLSLWDVTNRRLLMRRGVPEGEPLNLFFGEDAKQVVYLSRKEGRSLWNRMSMAANESWTALGGPDGVRHAAPLPTGTVVFLAGNRVGLFTPFAQEPTTRYLEGEIPAAGLCAFDVSPDGRGMACGYEDRTLTVWRLTDGSE